MPVPTLVGESCEAFVDGNFPPEFFIKRFFRKNGSLVASPDMARKHWSDVSEARP
jgi:hypothetical protein